MTLALTTALLSVILIVLSQVQRRTARFDPWLPWVTRILIIAVLSLAAIYFYQGFIA